MKPRTIILLIIFFGHRLCVAQDGSVSDNGTLLLIPLKDIYFARLDQSIDSSFFYAYEKNLHKDNLIHSSGSTREEVIPMKAAMLRYFPYYSLGNLSTNITLLISNEINIGYELRTQNNQGFGIHVGVIYPNKLLSNQAVGWINSTYFFNQGFSVRAELKTYLDVIGLDPQRYLSFMLLYKSSYYNDKWLWTGGWDKTDTYNFKHLLVSDHKQLLGLQARTGILKYGAGGWNIDAYVGIGVRAGLITSTTFGESICECMEELDTTTFDSSERYFLLPSFHLGLRIGYGWKFVESQQAAILINY